MRSVDDDPLLVLQEFTNDYGLVEHVTCNAIRAKEIYRLEGVRFQRGTQLLKRGSIQVFAAEPVIDVFFDELVTIRSNVLFQLCNLALDSSFFLLCLRAYTGVEGGALHIPESIPYRGQRVESSA
jgi:hypothetical protein